MNVPHFNLKKGKYEEDENFAQREFRVGLALLIMFWSGVIGTACAALACAAIAGIVYALIPVAVFCGVVFLVAMVVLFGMGVSI